MELCGVLGGVDGIGDMTGISHVKGTSSYAQRGPCVSHVKIP